ncbi:hypothetical protein TNCV_640991 [Trichonephila clavipes]|nr:hypothetical protein TNCV_640991 [Trichonephila clavipes]
MDKLLTEDYTYTAGYTKSNTLKEACKRNRSTYWTKPSNCDTDQSSLDAGGTDVPSRTHLVAALRRIVLIALRDRIATSQTIAQQIQSVPHHSVSTRNIRCRLQLNRMSARRPLLRLLLTGNQRRLHRQWCVERQT